MISDLMWQKNIWVMKSFSLLYSLPLTPCDQQPWRNLGKNRNATEFAQVSSYVTHDDTMYFLLQKKSSMEPRMLIHAVWNDPVLLEWGELWTCFKIDAWRILEEGGHMLEAFKGWQQQMQGNTKTENGAKF